MEIPFAATSGKNFFVFSVRDFIAEITQRIPDRGAQMVRYCGGYSNKARGMRLKGETAKVSKEKPPAEMEDIVISDYEPKSVPSKKWRALIKRVWEVDPLLCPTCGGELRIMALIDEGFVIE